MILQAIRSDLTRGEIVGYDDFLPSLIHRTFVSSRLSHSVLLAGLLYLLRFRYLLAKHRNRLQKRMDFQAPSMTFVFFISAMSLASKFHLDTTVHNRIWSDHSGVSITTINRVESIILEVIEFKLTISKAAFDDWVTFLFKTEKMQGYKKYQAERSSAGAHQSIRDLLKEFEQSSGSTLNRIIS